MASFKYKALNAAGKTVEGSIEQASADLAAHALAAEGLMLLSLEEGKGKKASGQKKTAGKRTRGSASDRLLHFTRELSDADLWIAVGSQLGHFGGHGR